MRRIRNAIVGLTLLLPIAGCGSDEGDGAPTPETGAPEQSPATVAGTDSATAGALPPGVTVEMVQTGQQLFGTVCVACHGPGGAGTPLGPALNDAEWINIAGEYDQIRSVIRAGVLQPKQFPNPMPVFDVDDFTDDQVRALAAYVYSISHRG